MKPIRDTKLGAWLAEKAPDIAIQVGDVLPDKGTLGIVKNLLRQKGHTPEDIAQYEKLADAMLSQEEQRTARWGYDVSSNSWLAKNVRPIIVIVLVALLPVFMLLDWYSDAKTMPGPWVDTYKTVLITVISGYFVLRSVDKNQLPWQR